METKYFFSFTVQSLMKCWALERNQSKHALTEIVKGGFFLRKNPLGDVAFGVQHSGFSIAPEGRFIRTKRR